MLKGMLGSLIVWYQKTLLTGGYFLIALLMAMESSILPLPSEVVIPPAAHLAWTGQMPPPIPLPHDDTWLAHLAVPLSLASIIIAGTLGSWIGATIMYWAARFAGRPLFLRYGKWILVTPEKIEGAERWADHYGSMGIFISRLVPVVRHLIGIPAGVVRMSYKLFSLYTLLGSAVWCAVLCWFGIRMGEDERVKNLDMHQISLWLGGAMLVLGGLYYFLVHRQMKKPQG